MRIIRIIAIMLIGVLLISGACASPRTPATVQIKIEIVDAAEEWRPSSVSVSAGDVVSWLNTGNFQHALVSGEGLFKESLSPKQSFNYTFTRSGTFTYHDEPYTSVGQVYVK